MDEINLREYLEILKKRWMLILLIAIVMAAGANVLSRLKEPMYAAEATVLVRSSGGADYSGLAGLTGLALSSGKGNIRDMTNLLQSKVVAAKVLKDLNLRKKIKGWDNPVLEDSDLAGSVKGMLKQPRVFGNLVSLRVEYSDPVISAQVADGFAEALAYYWNKLSFTEAQKQRAYIESQLPRVRGDLEKVERKIKSFSKLGVSAHSIEFQRLDREFKLQESVYIMLRKEYEAVKLEESKEVRPFTVVDKAEVPKSPFKPRIKRSTQIGFMLGIFSGAFLALLLDRFSRGKVS